MVLIAEAKIRLVYCFPANGHYVVVSSGIPFWTTPPPAPRPAAAAAPAPGAAPAAPARTAVSFGGGSGARALLGMKDFLLFRENNSNVISSGYFNNEWKMQAKELSELKAAGVVTISE
jgi:hypothetical protein